MLYSIDALVIALHHSIDDRVFFLESVKKVFPQVVTVLVQRPEGRFQDAATPLCDQRVTTLAEAEVFFGGSTG